MSESDGPLKSYASALACLSLSQPFLGWLIKLEPGVDGKRPGEASLLLRPTLFAEFKSHLDARVVAKEIASKSGYKYKGEVIRILRRIWLRNPAVFGPGWSADSFQNDEFIDGHNSSELYSPAEAKRILNHCTAIISKGRDSYGLDNLLSAEIAANTLLGLKLGIEPECIAALTHGNLLPERDGLRMTVRYIKNRGGGGSYRKRRSANSAPAEEMVAAGETKAGAAGVLALLRDAAQRRLSAHALLRRLPEGARLLMVGDEAQLPPVGFGLLFHRLIQDNVITARLQKVHRQTEAGGIPMVASAIRCGRTPALQAYVGSAEGVTIVACGSTSLASAVITVHQELSAQGREALVVTATNEGQAGVQGLNSSFHKLHVDATADVPQLKGPLGQWFSVGEPVVYLRNDYRRGLFNGLMGRIVAIDLEAGSCRILFEGYDSAHDVGATDLIDVSLAYTVTCHRAQGSQAEAVIIPLYETQVMDPSWLYTAVTRAERQVVLVGPPGLLRAIQQKPRASDRRQIGFEWCEVDENG